MTAANIVQKLDISKSKWLVIEKVLVFLKLLQAFTTLFLGELETSVPMVKPIMNKIFISHCEYAIEYDTMAERFKNTISYQLTARLELT